jgi:hypothetical protein
MMSEEDLDLIQVVDDPALAVELVVEGAARHRNPNGSSPNGSSPSGSTGDTPGDGTPGKGKAGTGKPGPRG